MTAAASHSSELSSIALEFNTNNTSSQYIYGQIYATGVATKDTLALLAEQADQSARELSAIQQASTKRSPDNRIPAELVLLVLAAAMFMATAKRELEKLLLDTSAAAGLADPEPPPLLRTTDLKQP